METITKHPGGRPSIYSPELTHKIFSRIKNGKSVRSVCSMEDMPSLETFYNWIDQHPEFLEQYQRACVNRTDSLIEQCLDIADDGTNDFVTIVKGDETYEVENKEVTFRSKLRVDTRLKIAQLANPTKYGKTLDVTTKGKSINDKPLPSTVAECEAVLADIRARRQGK